MSKFKTAIIGVGRIGFTLGFDKKREQPASHTFALMQNKNIQLVAACDTCEESLQLWKKHTKNTKIYTNLSQMLAEDYYDIVVIAVNEEHHFSVTMEVLASKPRLIILEKPVATSVDAALQIEQKAQELNVPILINHERRFAKDYQLAKKMLPKIGQLQYIKAALFSGLRVYKKSEDKTGFYSLLHDGTHLVDIVSFLLDGNIGDCSINHCISDDEKCIRNVDFSAQNTAGVTVSFSISGRSRFFGFELDILGTEGRIRIGNGLFEIFQRKESSLYSGFYSLVKTKKIKAPKKTEYFSGMVTHAVDFLQGKTDLQSTISDGIQDLRILENIKKDLQSYC